MALSYRLIAAFACQYLLLGFVALQGAPQTSSSVPALGSTPTVEDLDEYAVLSVLLSKKSQGDKLQRFVIADHTIASKKGPFTGIAFGLTFSGARPPEVQPDTKVDFDTKGRDTSLLAAHFNLKLPYVLVSDKELHEVFRDEPKGSPDQEGWHRFYERYPGAPGILAISRVGFNASKDQAMIFVIHRAGFLAGSGVFYVMHKQQDGGWEIEKEVTIWLS